LAQQARLGADLEVRQVDVQVEVVAFLLRNV
jgi:hypothetical protein